MSKATYGGMEIGIDMSLNDALHDLNALISLEGVKSRISDLIALCTVQNMRKKQGLHTYTKQMMLNFEENFGTRTKTK